MRKQRIALSFPWHGLLAAAVSLPGLAGAATLYKTADDNNLNLTNSWVTASGGTVNPAAIATGDTLYFDNTMAATRTHSLGADLSVGQVRVDGTSLYGETINAGNLLTLNNGASAMLLNSGTGGSLTLNCDVLVNNSAQTWVNGNNGGGRILTVGGNVNLQGNVLGFGAGSGSASIIVNGLISGTASTAGLKVNNGTALVTLGNSDNTFAGPVTVIGGQLIVSKLANAGSTSSLGTGTGTSTITLNGGSLVYNGPGGQTTDRSITMLAGAAINNNSSANGAITIAAPLIQSGTASARTLTLGGSSTADSIFGAVLADSGAGANISSLAKSGASVWIVTNAQTYKGSTTINTGILRLNGGGVLGGTAGSSVDSSNIVFSSSTANGALEFPTVAALGPPGQVRFRNTGGTAGSGGALRYVGTTGQTLDKTFQCDSSIGIRLESDSVGGSLTWNGAFSDNGVRPFYLGGSGTGPNTVQTSIGGTRNLTKKDAGTWLLSGTNTYTGTTTVSAGTLALAGGAAIADTAAVILADYAGASLRLNDSETIGSLSGGAGDGTVDLGANTLTVSNTNSVTFSGALGGTGGVTKAGGGTLILAGVSTYTGPTTINAGNLQVDGSLAAGSAVTVATNALLSGIGTVNGPVAVNAGGKVSTIAGSLTVGSVNLSAGSSLNLNPSAGGWLIVSGADGVAINGNSSVTINLPISPTLYAGTYHLLQYSGSLRGAGLAGFKLGVTPPGASYTLVNNPGSPSYIDLVVVSAELWTGKVSSDWSTAALPSPKNWTFMAIEADYTNGAPVIFDDTAAGSTVVDISAASVAPASVYFNNSGLSYTLQGSAGISGGAALVKDGYNTLTILNHNTYTGGTTISQGTLQIGANGTTGAIAGDIVDNGALVLARADNLAVAGNISGTGTLNNSGAGVTTLSGANTYSGQTSLSAGTLKAGGPNALSPNSPVTTAAGATLDLAGYSVQTAGLDGAGTVTNSGAAAAVLSATHAGDLTFSGAIVDGVAPTALTKAGNGTLTLTSSNAYTGGTLVQGGVLFVGDGVSSGSILGNVGISNGATFRISRSDTVDFSSGISGAGNVSAWGPGTLILSGNNTWSGNTAVAGSGSGTLETTPASHIGTGSLNLNNIASAVVRLRSDQTVSEVVNGAVGSILDVTNTTFTVNGFSGAVGSIIGSTFVSRGALVLRGGTNTIMNADGSAGASGNFFILNAPVDPSTRFALDTGSSTSSRKDFGFTVDSGTITLSSLSGYGAIRNDANGTNGVASWRTFVVDQATDTTFNGAVLSHAGTGGQLRDLELVKQGVGKLSLAGFIGKQTVAAGGANVPVNLTVTAGTLEVLNPANGTNTASGNLGTNTVTGGTLAFAANALGRGGPGTVVMNGGTLRWNAGNSQDVSSQLLLNDGITATFDTDGNTVALTNALGGGANASAALTKTGTGTLLLGGTNTYKGPTTVSAGALLVNGALDPASALTVQANATLGGLGGVGAVTVQPGGILAPGNGVGALTVSATPLLGGTTLMGINPTNSPNAGQLSAPANALTYGGALVVTNLGDLSFTVGTKFQLFSSGLGSYSGSFSSITLPPLPSGMAWATNLLADGSLVVTNGTGLPTMPTNVTCVALGGQMHLAWPSSYTGWLLQSNSVGVASAGNWYTVSGSTGTNDVWLNLDRTKANVFFRLVYPAP